MQAGGYTSALVKYSVEGGADEKSLINLLA
jgi:hypothetical protein